MRVGAQPPNSGPKATPARITADSERADALGFDLNAKLVHLTAVVASADWAPPRQTYEVFGHPSDQIDAQLDELSRAVETDVPAFGALIREAEAPAVGAAVPEQAAPAAGDD